MMKVKSSNNNRDPHPQGENPIMELLARLPWNQGMDKCALTKHYMDTSHRLNLRWTEFEGERGI